MHRLIVVAGLLAACKGNAAEQAETTTSAAPAARADGVDLPQVAGGGTVPLDPGVPVLSASPRTIRLDAMELVQIRDGAVDPSEKEGGASGRKLTRVNAVLAERAKAQPPAGEILGLAIDRRLTYGMLFDLIYSAKAPPATWKRFAVLVRAKDQTVSIPLTLPDKPIARTNSRGPGADLEKQLEEVARAKGDRIDEAPSTPDPQADAPLKLVVSISSQELLVWSISGQEGTLADPRLRVPRSDPAAMTKVGELLAEIAKRRWSGKTRGEDTRDLLLLAERATPMQVIAEAMATVRATPAGDELFPDIVLSEGFEASDAPIKNTRVPITPQGTIGSGGTVAEVPATGRIVIAQKQTFDETSLTPEVVVAKIQSTYLAGLKRCYRTHLVEDPAARGKVSLNFRVTVQGRTLDSKVRGFAAEVDECIAVLMKNWRFPIPKDSDGEATDASFSIMLQLTPE